MSELHDHGDWKTAETRIALVGDSTLDNVIWMDNKDGQKQLSVSQHLASSVGHDTSTVAVANLAADGFTSSDTLHGSERVISVGLRRTVDPVPFDEDGVFRPLAQLKELEPAPTHIVLSVGGNDVREILSNMAALPQIIAQFTQNYPAIVDRCLEVCPETILMLQYRPSWYMDGAPTTILFQPLPQP